MLAAVTTNVGHPVVAALLGLGAVALAAVVAVIAWHVHAAQIRLAEQLSRRQFVTAADTIVADHPVAANGNGNGHGNGHSNGTGPEVPLKEVAGGAAKGGPAPVVIDGPETVVTGGPVRYRVRPAGDRKVVSWAVGGGSVTQTPDPTHPDELLLVAERPGNLTVMVRVREGMTERRGTKSIIAAADLADTTPPFTLRLFMQAWSLIVVAVLIIGFAGALEALGDFASSDFIALVSPLAALVGVVAVARGSTDTGTRQGNSRDTAGPRA